MHKATFCFCLALPLAFTACASTSDTHADDAGRAIRAADAALRKAVAERNLEQIVSFYAEDAGCCRQRNQSLSAKRKSARNGNTSSPFQTFKTNPGRSGSTYPAAAIWPTAWAATWPP